MSEYMYMEVNNTENDVGFTIIIVVTTILTPSSQYCLLLINTGFHSKQ